MNTTPSQATRPCRRMGTWCTCLALTLGAAAGESANRAGAETYLESWRWSRFSTEDGLPSNRVRFVVEVGDETWAGTERGVAWYDGWSWNRITEEGGVPAEPVHSLLASRDGTIFVGGRGAIHVGDRHGFETIPFPDGLQDHVAHELAELGPGELLVFASRPGSPSPSLLRLDPGSNRFEPVELLSAGRRAEKMWHTSDGRAWISTGIGLFHSRDGVLERVLPSDRVRVGISDIAQNEDGETLVGVASPANLLGIWEWDAGSEPHVGESSLRGVVKALDVAPSGEAIAVYDSGVVRVRIDGDWMPVRPPPEALLTAEWVKFRASGDLWVGTNRGLYLHRRRSKRWARWRVDEPNALQNRTHDFLAARDGSLWLCTAGGIERRSLEGDRLPAPRLSELVTGLGQDSMGRMWACSGAGFEGLFVLDGEDWVRTEHDVEGNRLGLIHKIRKDLDGRLWFLGLAASRDDALEASGSVWFLDGDRIIPWAGASSISPNRFYDFQESPRGTFWFATLMGVSRLTRGEWTHWTADDGLPVDRTIRLCSDREGNMWLAHGVAGLSFIDSSGAVRRDKDFPPWVAAQDLAFDDAGTLWVTSKSGLHFRSGGRWNVLDIAGGLLTPRLWPILPLGKRVFVGSDGGGTFVLSVEAESPPPRITVSEATVEDSKALLRWRVSAWWNEVPRKWVSTRYRVDEGPWSEWSTDREVTLRDLEPGDHEFSTQARGLLGSLDTVGAGRAFNVPRPLLRRPAFLIPVVALSTALMVLGVSWTMRRRRYADALRRSEAEHRQFLEEAFDAILLCDESGVVLAANSKACELSGASREELVGSQLGDWLYRESGPFELDVGGTGGRRDHLEEIEVLRRDGTTVPVEAGTRRLEDGRVQAILRDLTERRELEQERKAFERSLTEGQRLESLGLLAGGVAHDFNNLLMVIQGSAEDALRRVEPGSRASGSIERIRTSALRAADLTQQLLAYAGRGVIRAEPVGMNFLVNEMGELLSTSVGRNVQLEYRLDSSLPRVEADSSQLQQVVLNLILNASDAIGSAAGRVVLSTRFLEGGSEELTEVAWDGLDPTLDWVMLEVSDDGVGMDADAVSRIFEPFYTTKFKGRGLGLAAVQGILHAHSGLIDVQSRESEGTTFRVVLPPMHAEPGADPAPDADDSADAWCGSGTVLVIDDETGVREVARGLLEHIGFDVLTARDGRSGVSTYLERSRDIQCVLLDLTMPGMTGSETLMAIRDIDSGARILCMSGYSEEANKASNGAERVAPFLHKPFTTEQLRESMRALMCD